MKIIYQKFITKQNLKDNPKSLYIFGDNKERKGYGGQAKVMRGEINSFGIITKLKTFYVTFIPKQATKNKYVRIHAEDS